jgi:hypothetical protein
MSFIFNNEIRYADSPNIDAFGRLRVSEPFNIFQNANVISSGSTQFETILSGSSSVQYNIDKSEIQFNVTGGGQLAIREQHGYNVYQAGKSQLVFMTGVFGTPVSDVIKSMGYYNDSDGLFFELSGLTFGIVLRTSTSGVPVDTFIPQSEWNIDTLNTGHTINPSGYHLDVTKTNIFIINFQWLGVGRVVYALDIDGIIVPIHQILNANNKTSVYMKTGTLPTRFEVKSNGGSDSTFKQICTSVISEGGQQDFGFIAPISNGLTVKTIASKQSVISVRLSSLFNGITNRATAIPLSVELGTTTASVNAYWELVLQRGHLGETNLGGTPTWNKLANTPFDFATNGTTITGGTTIASGYVITTTQTGDKSAAQVILQKEIMALASSGGTSSDYLHLVVTPNGSSSWTGIITMKSFY